MKENYQIIKLSNYQKALCVFATFSLCLFAQRGAPVLAKTQVAPPPITSRAGERAIVIDDVASPTGELKEKVQEIRQLVKEKVQEKLAEIKNREQKRAYVGEISAITGSTITLETKRGTKNVLVNEETNIVGPQRKTLKVTDLKVGDTIIAMGTVDPDGVMTAKRIVVVPKPPKAPPLRRAVFGRVKEIDKNKQILTVVHLKKEEVSFQVKASDKTRITKKLDGKMQKIDFSKIVIGDRLAAVGTWDETNQILTAKIIHVIPGKATGQILTPTP
jgi:hypothetical protein